MSKKIKSKEDFVERMKELTKDCTKSPINESTSSLTNQTLLEYKEASNGRIYGIVKESDKYFIKSSTSTENGKIDESDFTYMGGLANKLEYRYSTLTEAQRNLNYFLISINESLLEDEQAQEEAPAEPAQEAPAQEEAPAEVEPSQEAPSQEEVPAEPAQEETPAEDGESSEPAQEEEPMDDAPESVDKEAVQNIVGKLMSQISGADLNPSLTKWIINSIIGSLDLTKLKDTDKNKMIKKIKGELEEGENLFEEEMSDDVESTVEQPEMNDMSFEKPSEMSTGGQTVKIDLNSKIVDVTINESKLRNVVKKVIKESTEGKVNPNPTKLEKYVSSLLNEGLKKKI